MGKSDLLGQASKDRIIFDNACFLQKCMDQKISKRHL